MGRIYAQAFLTDIACRLSPWLDEVHQFHYQL
jgi:hypothetical protein